MRVFVLLIVLLGSFIGFSQQKNKTFKVTYNNGKTNEGLSSFVFQNNKAFLSKNDAKIKQFIDCNTATIYTTINFADTLYKTAISYKDLDAPIALPDTTQEILGKKCKLAKYNYFSNSIDVWYTENTLAKGSPYAKFIPRNALAMQVTINGQLRLKAQKIEKIKKADTMEFYPEKAKLVSKAQFEELKIKSRYKRLTVFENEQINYNPTTKIEQGKLELNKTYHFSKGSVIVKKIKLTEALKNSAYVHAKLHCKSNGDAYDRTGSIFTISGKETTLLNAYQNGLEILPVITDNKGNNYQGFIQEKGYSPPTEIMRFFTSFGAQHFNQKRAISNYNWANNVVYEREISDLIPNNEDELLIGIFIGNYDKGGHTVSLELEFFPKWEEQDTLKTKYINPLFCTVNTMEMSGQNYPKLFNNDTLRTNFNVAEDLEDLKLLFTTTGHGGWGNGDEFVPRKNKIILDGKEIFNIVPWRTDCGTYRLSNPASGNFENGLSSSDLSRSNWCPATLTEPYFIPLNDLTPGNHTIEIVIDQGKDEGTSFSSWAVSGVLVGKKN